MTAGDENIDDEELVFQKLNLETAAFSENGLANLAGLTCSGLAQ